MRAASPLPFAVVLLAACVGDTPVTPPPDSGGGDTSTNDTGTVDTGGPDAPNDGGPKTWCQLNAPTATFCDDFDTDPPLSQWTPVNGAGGTSGIANQLSQSAPRSLHAMTPSIANVTASARLEYSKAITPTKYVLEADLYLDSNVAPFDGGSTSNPNVLQLDFGNGFAAAIVVKPTAGVASFAALGQLVANLTIPFAAKAWHHAKIDVTRNGSTYDVKATVDNVPYAQNGISSQLPASTKVYTGLVSVAGPMPALDLYVDNVVLVTQ